MRKIVLSIFAVLTVCFGALAQNQRITGTVVDKDGQPVLAATVSVVGTTTATITDYLGAYEINAAKDASLEFSYVGMATQIVAVAGRTEINVTLEEDATQIEELVVIGYGSGVAAKSVVGSVSSVKGEKLENAPVANVGDVLQGKIPGLQVFTSTGEPAATSEMMMRGVSSISTDSSPLVIMDGVPVTSAVLVNTNSNDIESVVLLKDAASTSIYGARAANGVLYVTTKKGRSSERSSVRIGLQGGFSSVVGNEAFDLMSGPEQMEFQMLLSPELAQDTEWNAMLRCVKNSDFTFDWMDYAFRSNAPVTGIDMSITGSSGSTNYYLSMGNLDTEGVAPRSRNNRYTFRLNLDSKVKDWLKVGANVGLTYAEYQTASFGWSSFGSVDRLVYGMAPYVAPYELIYDYENWTVTPNYDKELDVFTFISDSELNPYYYYENFPSQSNDISLTANTFFEITPIKGLTIKGVQAIDAYDYRGSGQRLPSFDYGGYEGFGAAAESFSRNYQMTATNTAEYKFSVNDIHNVSMLVGQEAIVGHYQGFGAQIEGLSDDRLMLMTAGIRDYTSITAHSMYDWSYNSFFAKGSYNYDNLYHVDASVRTDGSSKFGSNVRWGTFWSLGGMWNLKGEEFMLHLTDINDLRLKVSYGTSGNSNISNYIALGLLGSGVQYNGQGGIGIASAANSGLTWEIMRTFNFGVSTRFKNKTTVEVDLYNRITDNMLMSIPYSATTGYSSGWGNVGKMRNRGVDFQFSHDLIQTRNLLWTINANVSYNNNTILELYGNTTEYVEGSTGLKFAVGHSMGDFFDVKFAGVDPRDGAPMWYDANGNKTKEYSTAHQQWLGTNYIADWTGGFGTALQWGNLMVSVDFSWVGERWMWMNEKLFTANVNWADYYSVRYERRLLDMWQKPGDITDIPKAGTVFQFDDRVYSNAAFLRLKNLSVSYNIPSSVFGDNNFIQGARVYMIGRNLWTLTNYLGFDPEYFANGSQTSYPGTRQYTFGLEMMF